MDMKSAAANTKSDRERKSDAHEKVFRILVIGENGSGESFSFL